jgi:dipeptidase D
VDAALASQLRSLMALCGLAGVQATARVAYPGWPPRPSSPIVQRAVAVHEEVLGLRPEVKAIHAGLECGVLVEKLPGLDAVSIGPEIRAPHSPDERVQIASVARFYKLLLALLEDLSNL